MARTFTWLQPLSGNFDGPGGWADITSRTPHVTLDAPSSIDVAVFNTASVTIGSVGKGEASTIEVADSTVSLIGVVQFGALEIGASTLDAGADGTLHCVPAHQAMAQVAVVVGSGAVLGVAGAGARVVVQNGGNGSVCLRVVAGGASASVSAAA